MLAAIGIDAQANAQPAAVFFPARTRGEFSMSMSGWGTLTGEAHYTLSSLAHSNDKDKKFGAFNVLGYKNAEMDKLIQDAAVEMDEAKRRGFLEKANELVAQGPPAPADRRGRLGLGDAEGQGDHQAARRRRHAGDEHQAGEVDRRPRAAPTVRRARMSLERDFDASYCDRHPWRLRHARRATCSSESEWAEARAHLANALRAGWAILAARRHGARRRRGRRRRDGGLARTSMPATVPP